MNKQSNSVDYFVDLLVELLTYFWTISVCSDSRSKRELGKHGIYAKSFASGVFPVNTHIAISGLENSTRPITWLPMMSFFDFTKKRNIFLFYSTLNNFVHKILSTILYKVYIQHMYIGII